MNTCACGHTVENHELVRIGAWDPLNDPPEQRTYEHVRCTVNDCRCEAFTLPDIPAWIAIARLAEHVRRNDNRVTIGKRPADVVCTVTDIPGVDAGLFHHRLGPDEELQLCEMLSLKLAEHVQDIAKGRTASPSWKPPEVPCPTCNQARDVACRPMHDGERAPGGWSHPARLMTNGDAESPVVTWARRVKRGELQTEVLPGVAMRYPDEKRRDNELMIAGRDKVVDEILALAYINEAALIGVRTKEIADGYRDADGRRIAHVRDQPRASTLVNAVDDLDNYIRNPPNTGIPRGDSSFDLAHPSRASRIAFATQFLQARISEATGIGLAAIEFRLSRRTIDIAWMVQPGLVVETGNRVVWRWISEGSVLTGEDSLAQRIARRELEARDIAQAVRRAPDGERSNLQRTRDRMNEAVRFPPTDQDPGDY